MMRAAVLLLLSLLTACGIPENGPQMRPGQDCLRSGCHGPGADRHWYAAGTVYADPNAKADEGIQGAEVHITDAKNRKLTLKTNGAGNFYTAETLVFPVDVTVHYRGKVVTPASTMPDGACNSCHTPDGQGRIYAP